MRIHDIDDAVKQVQWAKEQGLKGVLLPAGVGDLPFYHHPRYEPIWNVYEDLELLDRMYDTMFRHEQERLSVPPSEYWKRQCTVQSRIYGFDLDELDRVAAEVGPEVSSI